MKMLNTTIEENYNKQIILKTVNGKHLDPQSFKGPFGKSLRNITQVVKETHVNDSTVIVTVTI